MFTSLAGGIHAKLPGSSSDSGFVVFIELLKMSLNLGVRIVHGRALYTGKYGTRHSNTPAKDWELV